jgi:hypothetical protein
MNNFRVFPLLELASGGGVASFDGKLRLVGVFPLGRERWRGTRRARSVRDDGIAGLTWLSGFRARSGQALA